MTTGPSAANAYFLAIGLFFVPAGAPTGSQVGPQSAGTTYIYYVAYYVATGEGG